MLSFFFFLSHLVIEVRACLSSLEIVMDVNLHNGRNSHILYIYHADGHYHLHRLKVEREKEKTAERDELKKRS